MHEKLVFSAKDVVGYTPADYQGIFESRMLVDRESVGSEQLTVNLFSLKPGRRNEHGSHPAPYDEFYYVLRGRGLVRLGEAPDVFEIAADSVVFIPGDLAHSLENTGTEDLDILTVMPRQPVEGVNVLYDWRKRDWGTTFRLVKK